MSGGPLVCLAERWPLERIDNRIWVLVDPATGTAWNVTANNGRLVANVAPNASETARISSQMRWSVGPSKLSEAGSVIKSFEVEFEIFIDNDGNLDAAECMLGLADATDTKYSTVNDFIGWTLSGGSWYTTVVEGGGAADTQDTTEALGARKKLKFLIINDDVHFWVDGVYERKVDITSIDGPLYFTFYFETGVGGASQIYLGEINGRPDDTPVTDNYQDVIPEFFAKITTDEQFLVRLVSRFNPREAVTGVTYDNIEVKYAADTDSGFTGYTPASGDWTELGEGWYLLNIGEGEFADSDTKYLVTVADDLSYFADYQFIAHVCDMTIDEFMDYMGGGPSTVYNLYNMMNNSRSYTKQILDSESDIRNLVVKTKNLATDIRNKQKKEDK